MHDLYVNATPNGFKAMRELEEARMDHRCVRVRLAAAEHSAPSFLGISPNNKVA